LINAFDLTPSVLPEGCYAVIIFGIGGDKDCPTHKIQAYPKDCSFFSFGANGKRGEDSKYDMEVAIEHEDIHSSINADEIVFIDHLTVDKIDGTFTEGKRLWEKEAGLID
jgi:hypothetical protein